MLDIENEKIKRLDGLARSAINHWGADKQFAQAEEEAIELALELALELVRIRRNRQDWDAILEEAVDVYIMATEIFILFGPEKVNEMLDKKLDKFDAALKKSIQAKVDSIMSIQI